jgi:hypothetical protein
MTHLARFRRPDDVSGVVISSGGRWVAVPIFTAKETYVVLLDRKTGEQGRFDSLNEACASVGGHGRG